MKITITIDTCAENFDDLRKFLDAIEKVPIAPGEAAPAEASAFEVIPPKPVSVPEAPAPQISAQDVKAVCLKMSKAGRQTELKAAFAKFGGKKLSDIAEADYPALMKELGNA